MTEKSAAAGGAAANSALADKTPGIAHTRLPAGVHLDAVVSFTKGQQAGGAAVARRNAFHVIDQTQVCSITANLDDTKTTITHPASTSHGRLSEDQRQAAGITQGLIRLAVGLEDVRDLQADLLRGFETMQG